MAELVIGDLFESREQYLAHQCNCITRRAAHLAREVFRRYPEANIYRDRAAADVPGTIDVRGRVINMLAQYRPGNVARERAVRETWFQSCLLQIGDISGLASIAFPYQIGCGAAGGDWEHYRRMIDEFARDRPDVVVRIYQLPEQAAEAAGVAANAAAMAATKRVIAHLNDDVVGTTAFSPTHMGRAAGCALSCALDSQHASK
jgi:hypothetical protein